VIVENGDFRFFRSLSSEDITYMATQQLSRDATVHNLGNISTVIRLFGLTENAGHENDGPSKLQDMKLQDKIVLGLHYITMKCVVI